MSRKKRKSIPNYYLRIKYATSKEEKEYWKKEQIDSRYEIYKEYYKKQNEKTATGMLRPMMSVQQFKEAYENMRDDYKAQVLNGERKAVGNVIQDLVREDAYGGKYATVREWMKKGIINLSAFEGKKGMYVEEKRETSNGQFETIKVWRSFEYLKETEDEVKVIGFSKASYHQKMAILAGLSTEAIRNKELFNWEIIKEEYHKLKDQGIGRKQAGQFIAQTFFGSR